MTYRSKENVVLPLYVQTQIHFNKDGGSVSVMLGLKGGVTDKPVEARVTIPFSLGKRKKKRRRRYRKFDQKFLILSFQLSRLQRLISRQHMERFRLMRQRRRVFGILAASQKTALLIWKARFILLEASLWPTFANLLSKWNGIVLDFFAAVWKSTLSTWPTQITVRSRESRR